MSLHFTNALKPGPFIKSQFIPAKPIIKGSHAITLLSRPTYIQAPLLSYEPRYLYESQNRNRSFNANFYKSSIASRYYSNLTKQHPFWGSLAQHVNNILNTPTPTPNKNPVNTGAFAKYKEFVKNYTKFNGLSSVLHMYKPESSTNSLPVIKHITQKTSQLDLSKTINSILPCDFKLLNPRKSQYHINFPLNLSTYQYIQNIFQRNFASSSFQTVTLILTHSYKLQAIKLISSPYPNLQQLGQLLISILPSIQRLTWKITLDPKGLKIWFPIPFTAESIKSFLGGVGFPFKPSKFAQIQSIKPSEEGIIYYDKLMRDRENFEFLQTLNTIKLRQ